MWRTRLGWVDSSGNVDDTVVYGFAREAQRSVYGFQGCPLARDDICTVLSLFLFEEKVVVVVQTPHTTTKHIYILS